MTRRAKWQVTHGYAVISIPDDGLFIREGRLETGHGTPVVANELVLFSRQSDADQHAADQEQHWAKGDAHGHEWSFPVIPVLVSERK